MTLTERILSTDYAEVVPLALVGHCFCTNVVAAHSVTGTSGKGFDTSAAVSDGFTTLLELGRTVSTDVTISQGFSAYKLDPDYITNPPSLTPVAPTVGDPIVLPAISGGPPEINLGTVPMVQTLVLTNGSDTITVKSPKYGNSDTLDYRRVNDQTVGGRLIIFRDPSWTSKERLDYEIENLTREEARALQDFLIRNLGKTITLTDHFEVEWQVRSVALYDSVEGFNYRYSLKLEFETIE